MEEGKKRALLPRPKARKGRQEAEEEQVEPGDKGTSTFFPDAPCRLGVLLVGSKLEVLGGQL